MTLLKPAELPAIELSATNIMTVLFWHAVELQAILPSPPPPSTAKQNKPPPCHTSSSTGLAFPQVHATMLP
jgi:hypothetical protein